MHRLPVRLLFLCLALLVSFSHAQAATSCTTTTPCVQVQITNPNPLPSNTILLECSGGSCTQASLTSYLATQTATNLCPAVSSIWKCTTFSQTKTPQLYNDPEGWGILVTYSTQGTTAGGVAATSPLVTFSVPAAPAQGTSITGLPTTVTTGTAGPQ